MPTPQSWLLEAQAILFKERSRKVNPDDLAWATVTPKKCRRHEWYEPAGFGNSDMVCRKCQKVLDPLATRRGRNNRSRGNAIERWVCKLLGIQRVGMYGGPDDGRGDHLVVQVKSGGAHQAALLAKIHTVPANADQLRGWVTVSTPGAGHPREGVISFDLREFAMWYGKGIPDDGTDEAAA